MRNHLRTTFYFPEVIHEIIQILQSIFKTRTENVLIMSNALKRNVTLIIYATCIIN
jgi:hypothetical protein